MIKGYEAALSLVSEETYHHIWLQKSLKQAATTVSTVLTTYSDEL